MGERRKKKCREDSLCLDKNIMLISTDGMRNTEKVHDSLIGFWQNVLAGCFFRFFFFLFLLTVPVCCNSSSITRPEWLFYVNMFEANSNELSFYQCRCGYKNLPNTRLNSSSVLCVWMASCGTYFCTVWGILADFSGQVLVGLELSLDLSKVLMGFVELL